MNDEEEFNISYAIRMSGDDCECKITLKCDEPITYGILIDALEQMIVDLKIKAESKVEDH